MSHMPSQQRLYVRLLEWSILLPALAFAAGFIYVATESMSYPFMLEWMEGQTLDVVQRVLEGKPLYVEPSLDYVPLIYPPYYYYVAAFASMLTGGLDFFPARLVSFIATLGSGAVIFAWLRQERAGWRVALAGACFFFATYKLSGRWFDMSRVDSLFLFLTLAGLYMAIHTRGVANAIGAALLLAIAFFTKQTALLITAPVLLMLFLVDMRHTLWLCGAYALFCLSGLLALDQFSAGWYNFYAFTVPAGHSVDASMYAGFWHRDVFGRVGVLFLMSIITLAYVFYQDGRKGFVYLGLAIGLVGASYVSRVHSFGYINVLMPMHAFFALMGAMALAASRKSEKAIFAMPLVGIALMLELSTLMYNPVPLVPTEEMKQAGERFTQQLQAIEGDVFMPEIQFVQTRAGKRSYAFGMAAFDIFRSDLKDHQDVKTMLWQELATALQEKRFAAVVPGRMTKLPKLKQYYQKTGTLDYPQRYVTGALSRVPTNLLTPKPQ